MTKEKLQAELDGLKTLLKDIEDKITVDWLNDDQSSTDEFESLNEFFTDVYDLQRRTTTQSRIGTPQELVGFDLLTDEEAEQLVKDVLETHGVSEVAELLQLFADYAAGIGCWYCYDNDTKHLFNACQDNVIELVFDNIQTSING